ncbi:hypothetical protein [Lacticaseibacillus rhamnosus]|uniref:UvrABC system protein A n=1 Tax=Lacticaseibacillus rhamnosus LRHMDP3 TaxID=1203259 RepID=A0AB33XQT4_LACRH|nr:hypothetical protein [Lacticaseibacillus rhamnosus]EKS48490.1 Excinuclease ABC subunit A [Lacticaseibacillus rhamnosus LRHMDP3]EKS48628.1 Excinuclease ABC subunit A [Lacticaseibacillus rhamnosus LRHMDP2]
MAIPDHISVRGAYVNNLKHLNVDIPLNKLVAITGRSGSGKSSLAMGVLYAEGMRRYMSTLSTYTRRRLGQTSPAAADSVKHIPSAIALRQRPVVPGIRSTVGTATEALNVIRLMFSRLGSPVCPNGHRVPPTLDIAKAMDLPNDGESGMGMITCPTCGVHFMAFAAEDFAFNSTGACPTCGGTGVINLDIQYLPDMQQTCPTCHGRRYNPEVLKIKWHERSIADLLDLDVDTALTVFKDEPTIVHTLQTLHDMGLGYLHLGESTPTLSGGEAQRLKLVAHMGRSQKDTLFVFDEPSVGLHPLDVQTLVAVFQRLLQTGATVIAIEHDLDVIANADYVLDLGPKGGAEGGHVMAAGTPQAIAKQGHGETAKYLAAHLAAFHVD